VVETRRTTLALDEDVLQALKERAAACNETLGRVVSDMVREKLTTPSDAPRYRNGILLLPPRKFVRKATTADVEALKDDED
jgi:hypothetical protein